MPKPDPRRILLNMPSQHAGRASGVARMAFCLIEQLLATTPHDYILRSPWSRNQLPAALGASRLRTQTVQRPRFMILDVLRQALTFPALCRRLGIDLVLNLDPYGSATGGHARATVVHDLYHRAIPAAVGWRAALTTDLIFRLVTAGSRRLVAVSEATGHDLTRYYPDTGNRLVTIHSDSTLPPDLALPVGREIEAPYILAVGNATPNKNFGSLHHAFARLHARFPTLRLVHVGAADDGAVHPAIIHLQAVSDRRLAGLYRHALCLCVPSTVEGFCLPVLEAQQYGCPVVCSNAPALLEVAGTGALFFAPTNADALAAHVTALLIEPALSAALVARGARNKQRFSWAVAGRRYATAIDDLLESAP